MSATLAMPSYGHVMLLLRSVFYGAAMGGINSAQINLVFDYVSPEKRKNALSVKNAFCGLFGFGSTLVATPLLNYLQGLNYTFSVCIYMHNRYFPSFHLS